MDRIRVFCSHNSIDKDRVKAVASKLAEAGIDPWLDLWEISGGDSLVEKINDGLATSQVGLIFFSTKTLKKAWANAEIETLIYQSIEDGKAVIPVMLDKDAPIPELLRPRAQVAADDLQQLIDAIYGRSNKPTLAPSRQAKNTTILEIHLTPDGDHQLTVRAVQCGNTLAQTTATLPAQIERTYRQFVENHIPNARHASVQDLIRHRDLELARLGDALGTALFAADIETVLASAMAQARRDQSVLQLVFRAPDEWLALPFEAARLSDGRVLSLEPGIDVLRQPETCDGSAFDTSAGPLKILVAIGAPDETKTKNSVLDYERETQTILDALDHARQYGNAAVRILEVGHPEQISRALLDRSYHVLHLSGHGTAGVMQLEDEDGHPVDVTPEMLGDAIRRSGRPFPLVFLASCLSGTGTSDTAGFAQGLLTHGAPLVVAMQANVSDWYATKLAGEFYSALATMERPLASRALSIARQNVERQRRDALAAGLRQTTPMAEYATPTLFVGGDETPLVDRALSLETYKPPAPLPSVGTIPMLRMDELIGRRESLRTICAALRDVKSQLDKTGRRSGVLVRGMGGVGKSAIAGRAMQRLADDQWTIVAAEGRWSLGELATTIGQQLCTLQDTDLAKMGQALLKEDLPEPVRQQHLLDLVSQHRVLLVLDNFEDNLTIGGERYLELSTREVLGRLLSHTGKGKVLITCRYALPEGEEWLVDIHLGPLSVSETRKLFYRLKGLDDQEPETLRFLSRYIGGHPRMLEYLDAILRQGEAHFPLLAKRLRDNAKAQGLEPEELGGDFDSSVADTLKIGAEDILLGELIELLGTGHDLATLNQCAAFGLPTDVHGVAFCLAGGKEPTGEQIQAADTSVRHLINLSLLTPLDSELVWMHRWTTQELRDRQNEQEQSECARRAGEYRAWRVANVSGSAIDGREATRRFLEAQEFDRATQQAVPLLAYMERYGQQMEVESFLGEVLASLPRGHESYHRFCTSRGDALLVLGQAEAARRAYQDALVIVKRLAQAEPDRADYQRDLSVSYNRMGDLYRALGQGEAAREAYKKRWPSPNVWRRPSRIERTTSATCRCRTTRWAISIKRWVRARRRGKRLKRCWPSPNVWRRPSQIEQITSGISWSLSCDEPHMTKQTPRNHLQERTASFAPSTRKTS